jgi:hypothetical protein
VSVLEDETPPHSFLAAGLVRASASSKSSGGSGCHRLSSLRVDRFISEKLLVSRPHQHLFTRFLVFFLNFQNSRRDYPLPKNRSAITTTTGLRPFRYRYSYTFLFTFGHANPERLWPGLPWLFARIISIVTCSASFINSK